MVESGFLSLFSLKFLGLVPTLFGSLAIPESRFEVGKEEVLNCEDKLCNALIIDT